MSRSWLRSLILCVEGLVNNPTCKSDCTVFGIIGIRSLQFSVRNRQKYYKSGIFYLAICLWSELISDLLAAATSWFPVTSLSIASFYMKKPQPSVTSSSAAPYHTTEPEAKINSFFMAQGFLIGRLFFYSVNKKMNKNESNAQIGMQCSQFF